MAIDRYVIQGGVEGRERLRLLSEVMGPSTRALLTELGIRPGSRCLDLGCGGGDVTFELAAAAGPGGWIVGVDLDTTKIELAKREAIEKGLVNVGFEVRDLLSWEPTEKFDVVYARFLFTHLPDPGKVLSIMRRCIQPGGLIIVEDIDFRGHFAEPECAALKRYVELYTHSVQKRGGDPQIGPRLPELLRASGFQDVDLRLFHPVALQGGIKLLTCVTLEMLAEALIHDRLVTREEFHKMSEELAAFARDPHTVLGGPRVFQAWGRIPRQ
jgi:ubiquinone/menaquinone biosynthesis C-methylase UbiE